MKVEAFRVFSRGLCSTRSLLTKKLDFDRPRPLPLTDKVQQAEFEEAVRKANLPQESSSEKHRDAELEPLKRFDKETNPSTGEVGGPKGLEPTRFGDWERKGRVSISKQRTYRERSQPKAREKLGILEKKKDYVQRAKNFHFKEKRILALKEKARYRNPDEFYHAMINAKTDNGIHILERNSKFEPELLKLLKTQDSNYIRYQRSVNAKKLEKIENSLNFIEDADLPKGPIKHTIFVDNEEEAKSFDPVTHFETTEKYLLRPHNRQRKIKDEDSDLSDKNDGETLKLVPSKIEK
ncbi:U3 small nucleolar RNA-associated protein 11, partial [Nowakowskiella sp. JEL0078]